MTELTLKLEKRQTVGKKTARLRRAGLIPSVVYGAGIEAVVTQSPLVETTKVITNAGKHTPVNLTIDGQKRLAIIKDIDVDPAKHVLLHVAFQAIKQDELVTTEVPVRLTGLGESPAEKAGLVILQAIEQIEIKAKPADLPSALELSVVDLTTTDDKLTVDDLALPKGVEFDDAELDKDLVIANVYEPSALQAANEAAAGAAEPAEEIVEEPETATSDDNSDNSADSSDKADNKTETSEKDK